MDVTEVLISIRCAGCDRIFYRCLADYRGHIYCEDDCRRKAARASKARHQASLEGRLDHADHNVAYRARRRAEAKRVREARSDKLVRRGFVVRARRRVRLRDGGACRRRGKHGRWND